MTMSPLKKVALGAALLASGVAAHAVTLLSEGFNSVPALAGSGWVLTNESTPAGSTPGFFQGDANIFAAQSGAANSYAAANYNSAAAGGLIRSWLITPTFSTADEVTVSFWARGAADPGYFDTIAYGFSTSGSASTGSFVLNSATVVGGTWSQYTVTLAGRGAGSTARFGIEYLGAADFSNYVGIDTLTVTAVPEPTTWLLFGAGLLGVAARRRNLGAR